MFRSFILTLATGFATLLSFAAPQNALAQYGGYPRMPRYSPSQQPSYSPYQLGMNIQELAGTWTMSGAEDGPPCEIIPSPTGDRAMFINENGGRAEGYIHGNRIFVPRWRLQGLYTGDSIQWFNKSVWYRQGP